MFDISMLSGPILGAVIGYFTNYIAVKMLFRPLHPVYIGKWQVPFTPGIVPKGKERLAKAVGETVGEVLLVQEDLEKLLVSEQVRNLIKEQVHILYQKGRKNEATLEVSFEKIVGKEAVEHLLAVSSSAVSDVLYRKMMEQNLGNLVGEKVAEVVRQKTQGTFLAMMVNDKLITTIQKMVEDELNDYLAENGESFIRVKTQEEMESLANKTVKETLEFLPFSEEEIEKVVSSIYLKIVTEYFGSFMKHIPISKIVEDKMNAMDVKEVENLLLSIMKKELGAIVNLGALVGFVLGCMNLFI